MLTPRASTTLLTSWPSSSCRRLSSRSSCPSSSPLPSSPCCPPSLSEWRDQTVQARIAMHCGQLLQRNEENRESSEKRVDSGKADGTGIPVTRRVATSAHDARASASRRTFSASRDLAEVLIPCWFPARRKILAGAASARSKRGADLVIEPRSHPPDGCGQAKKSLRGIRAEKARRPRHSPSSGESVTERFGSCGADAVASAPNSLLTLPRARGESGS
jgi:hypothetical protein